MAKDIVVRSTRSAIRTRCQHSSIRRRAIQRSVATEVATSKTTERIRKPRLTNARPTTRRPSTMLTRSTTRSISSRCYSGEALTLYFLQDLSQEQMAELLNVPLGTVKSQNPLRQISHAQYSRTRRRPCPMNPPNSEIDCLAPKGDAGALRDIYDPRARRHSQRNAYASNAATGSRLDAC